MERGRLNYTRSGVIERLPDDVLVVMRRLELDYRAELHWPAQVDIGSVLLRIGTSSFAIGNGLFHGVVWGAWGVTTRGVCGGRTRRATGIPAGVRAGMQKHLFAGGDVTGAPGSVSAGAGPGLG